MSSVKLTHFLSKIPKKRVDIMKLIPCGFLNDYSMNRKNR